MVRALDEAALAAALEAAAAEGLQSAAIAFLHADLGDGHERRAGELARAAIFVQLLSGLTGKRLPGASCTAAGLQHECAVARGVPVLQWHSRGLDTAGVAQADHRALLQGPSVIVADLQEFKSLKVGDPPERPLRESHISFCALMNSL